MEKKTKLLTDSLAEIAARSTSEALTRDSRYVFASDLRIGDGGKRDELGRSGKALCKILGQWYLPRDYVLVLNGDVEDLRYFWLKDILAAWPKLYAVFDAFADSGRLRKIVGERDLALLKLRSYPYETLHGLRLDAEKGSILATHGHQASPPYFGKAYLDDCILRWMSASLGRKEAFPDSDGRGRFKAERRLHRAAARAGMPLIEGHTRRPLFESLSNRDAIRAELERLLRDGDPGKGESAVDALVDYCRKEAKRRSAKRGAPTAGPGVDESGPAAPSLFCPGRVVGARGLRFLEIGDGRLRLVRWSRKEGEIVWPASSYRIGAAESGAPLESIKGTPYRRMELRSTTVELVLERAAGIDRTPGPEGGG